MNHACKCLGEDRDEWSMFFMPEVMVFKCVTLKRLCASVFDINRSCTGTRHTTISSCPWEAVVCCLTGTEIHIPV